jgi:hypothetical protein
MFYVAMSIMESIFSLWANDRFGYGPRSIGIVFFVMGGIQALVQGVLYAGLGQGAPFLIASAIMLPVVALVGVFRPAAGARAGAPAG